jgi:hypothetical protein
MLVVKQHHKTNQIYSDLQNLSLQNVTNNSKFNLSL